MGCRSRAVLDILDCVGNDEKISRQHAKRIQKAKKRYEKSVRRADLWHQAAKAASKETEMGCWIVDQLMKGNAVAFPEGNEYYYSFLPCGDNTRQDRSNDKFFIKKFFRSVLTKKERVQLHRMLQKHVHYDGYTTERRLNVTFENSTVTTIGFADEFESGREAFAGRNVVLVKGCRWEDLWNRSLERTKDEIDRWRIDEEEAVDWEAEDWDANFVLSVFWMEGRG